MKSFKVLQEGFRQYLEEKLIIYNNGANYGQVVFLAGGAGSGKGFAITNFMQGDKFKVRDVDEWKQAFRKLAALGQGKHGKVAFVQVFGGSKIEKALIFDDKKSAIAHAKTMTQKTRVRTLSEIGKTNPLKDPADVFSLHMYVQKLGIKNKTLDLLLANAREGRLPNLIFDITAKSPKDITKVVPDLLAVGYNPKDIHLTWVLTKFEVAVQQNATRDRVVPSDILLKTHEGAATTMFDIVKGNVPKGVDGGVYVILSGKDHTIFWTDKAGKTLKRKVKQKDGSVKEVPTVKGFKYIQVKEPGKPVSTRLEIQTKIYNWVADSVPNSTNIAGIWG